MGWVYVPRQRFARGFAWVTLRRMIHHVVMLRLVGGLPEEEVEHFLSQAREILTPIPGVKNFEIGHNIREDNHPLALLMDFDSEEALETYQVHPEHQRFLTQVIGPIIAEKMVVDFAIG